MTTLTTWHPDGGDAASPLATWDLTGADALFTRSFILPFSVASQSRFVAILDGTELTGSFSAWEYDARDAASPETVGVVDKGTALYCKLPAPRRVVRVSLSHAEASATGYSVKLYRLDGDTIASSPTISVANDTTITDEFVAARFAVTLEDGSGARVNLSASHLATCRVCSVPTTPRILLLPPEGIEEPAVQLWQQPGQPQGAELDFTLTQALADALNSVFDAIPATGSTQPRIVLAADAPARVLVSGFAVAHETELLNLPWEHKRRFLFDGSGEQSHQVPLSLESGMQVTTAWCESSEKFGIPSTDLSAAPGVTETLQPENVGIRIHENAAVEQPFSLDEAVQLHALWSGLMGLVPGSSLVASVLEIETGREVCASEQTLAQAGWRGGVRVRFAPVVVPSGDYAVRILCDAGALMWFTTAGEKAARLTSGHIYDGLKGLYVLERAALSSELTAAGPGVLAARQPYELDIGGIPVAVATIGENGRRAHDLTGAISDALASGKPATLGISSRQKGEVTLYALTLRHI